jgi:hypothetical protein
MGKFSRSWDYQADDRMARVSVDFPFRGWHELTVCYEARGWKAVSQTLRDNGSGAYVAVELSKSNGEAAYLLFSLYDGAAHPIPRSRPRFRDKLAKNPLVVLLGLGDWAVAPTLTTLQIQQFITAGFPLDKAQRAAAEQMYLNFRHRLLSRWQTDATEK